MWTDDDVMKPPRWRRLARRVTTLDLDVLLRWSLVASTLTLTVFSALAILHYVVGLLVAAVALTTAWWPF